MPTKTVTLQPGESKEIIFTFTPTEARVHQVAVDGLSGSFIVLPEEPPPPVETFTIGTFVGHGSGTISPRNPTVPSGASQTLIITPSPGYYTANVWIDQRYNAGGVSSFTFENIISDHIIMVEFYRQ